MKKQIVFLLFTLSSLYASETFDIRAVIYSGDRTILSSQIAGKIVSVYKNNGDFFKKGQSLIKIDCAIFKAERLKIRNKLKLAKLKLEKNRKLLKYNSIGQFDIDTSIIEYEGKKIEYDIASINVKRCHLKAPFNGRVVEKKVNRFQSVKPQQELIEIVSSDNLEAKLVVPSNWLNWLNIGEEFLIEIDENSLKIKARVKQLDSIVDAKSQTVRIRASIDKNLKLIPGMSGTAKFQVPTLNKKAGE